MDRFLSDQTSIADHAFVNHLLPSISPSIVSLSQPFPGGSSNYGSRMPACYASLVGSRFLLRQPPLLPLPRKATVSVPIKGIPSSSVRTIRKNSKRKGKKETWSPTKVKEEPKPAIKVGKVEKVESMFWLKSEKRLIEEEEEMMESVYLLSPPPSSLPFPRFSLTRPKAVERSSETVSRTCNAEVVATAAGTDAVVSEDLSRRLMLI